jgi:hypothetical protein
MPLPVCTLCELSGCSNYAWNALGANDPHFPVVVLARVIHDGSSRNRTIVLRDGRPKPRGPEAYLKQYGEGLSGEAARMAAG